MSFKEIINQDHAVRFLSASFGQGRLAGAYLFLGPQGAGREKTAQEFAKLINCQTPSDDCCDECHACRAITDNKHVDVRWVRPINNTITIDQVRELQHAIYLRPYELLRKVFVICDAQCLNEEASNALLKTLEEPPESAVLILIALQTTAVLDTISSRCQKVVFNAVGEERLKQLLQERHQVSADRAHLLSYLTHGNIKDALELAELGDELLQKRAHILNAIYFKKFALFKMEEFSLKDNTERRRRLGFLLDMVLSWLRDLLMIKTNIEAPLINQDKKTELVRSSGHYSSDELMQGIESVASAKNLVSSDTNINVKLAFAKMRADLWK